MPQNASRRPLGLFFRIQRGLNAHRSAHPCLWLGAQFCRRPCLHLPKPQLRQIQHQRPLRHSLHQHLRQRMALHTAHHHQSLHLVARNALQQDIAGIARSRRPFQRNPRHRRLMAGKTLPIASDHFAQRLRPSRPLRRLDARRQAAQLLRRLHQARRQQADQWRQACAAQKPTRPHRIQPRIEAQIQLIGHEMRNAPLPAGGGFKSRRKPA